MQIESLEIGFRDYLREKCAVIFQVFTDWKRLVSIPAKKTSRAWWNKI